MSDEPREKRLSDYNELLEGLLEMVAMQEEAGGEDAELQGLIQDAEEQLRALATSLNAEETISVTPGLVKVLLPNSADGKGEQPVVLYPPTDTPRQSAPYEVHYDHRYWYPCVITAVVPPEDATARVTYKAWILGYNVEETVLSEDLRPWGKAQETERKESIRSGAACHAIRPTTGCYEAATIERLTLEGTVMVRFPAADPPASSDGEKTEAKEGVVDAVVVELPLSHVYTAAKFYAVLRKRPQLTEEEKRARRQENARRKRERAEEEKQMKADKVAQDASDWQTLMGDMLGGGPRRRGPRL